MDGLAQVFVLQGGAVVKELKTWTELKTEQDPEKRDLFLLLTRQAFLPIKEPPGQF